MVSQSRLPRRPLGRTALPVSVLGVGTAPLGDLYRQLDDETAVAAVECAFALDINLLDISLRSENSTGQISRSAGGRAEVPAPAWKPSRP